MRGLSAAILFVHLGFVSGCVEGSETQVREFANEVSDSIPVSVDPAVEMVSIIYRLAGVPPFNTKHLPSYADDIREWFGPYRDHRAIRVVEELAEEHGIDGSAPMALAVYLEAPRMEGRVPLSPLPGDLDPRWTPETVAIFQEAIRTFAEDTRFMEFFAGQQEFYGRSVHNLLSSLEGHAILPWLEAFFGQEAEHYSIILNLQIGTGNYGLSRIRADGSKDCVSIMGATSPPLFRHVPRFSDWWFVPTVVHEFAHSFVNPVVDRNETALRDVAERLYPYHQEELWPQGYRSWRTLCYEYLVRASVNRYLKDRGELNAMGRRIDVDIDQGFVGIARLTETLAEYEDNRDLYPGLDAFIPQVEACFQEILRNLEG